MVHLTIKVVLANYSCMSVVHVMALDSHCDQYILLLSFLFVCTKFFSWVAPLRLLHIFNGRNLCLFSLYFFFYGTTTSTRPHAHFISNSLYIVFFPHISRDVPKSVHNKKNCRSDFKETIFKERKESYVSFVC